MAAAKNTEQSQTRNPIAILVVAAFAAFLATFNETYLNVGFVMRLWIRAHALECAKDKGISGAPVIDLNGAIVGFVSDGDIMRVLADQVPSFKSAWSFIVESENADFERTLKESLSARIARIMKKGVVCVGVADDMGAVARVLAERHLKKAPVMDGEKMVGIVN